MINPNPLSRKIGVRRREKVFSLKPIFELKLETPFLFPFPPTLPAGGTLDLAGLQTLMADTLLVSVRSVRRLARILEGP
jgi:hypothetical protein